MIYTGTDLKVRICTRPTHYHHWMSFACYGSISRYLPDAKVELVVFGRANFYYDWARRFKIPILQKQETTVREQAEVCLPILPGYTSGVLSITPECVAVRPFDIKISSSINESGTACLFRGGELAISDSLCCPARSDLSSPFVDATNGVGFFDRVAWLEKAGCFLSNIDRFSAEDMTHSECAVLKEWKKTATVIATLFASN